jgi:hypothetical protein
MQYGLIGYVVPHRVYPAGYHCDPRQPVPFAGLAAQKNGYSFYLMCLYGGGEHERWFRETWARTGKKLDMGKCCVRFKKLADLPLDVVGQAVRRVPARTYLAHYESSIRSAGKGPSAEKSAAAKTRPAQDGIARTSSAKSRLARAKSAKSARPATTARQSGARPAKAAATKRAAPRTPKPRARRAP